MAWVGVMLPTGMAGAASGSGSEAYPFEVPVQVLGQHTPTQQDPTPHPLDLHARKDVGIQGVHCGLLKHHLRRLGSRCVWPGSRHQVRGAPGPHPPFRASPGQA